MVLLQNVYVDINEDLNDPEKIILKSTGIKARGAKLKKRSIDARHRGRPRYCCAFVFECDDEESIVKKLKNAVYYKPAEYNFNIIKGIDKGANRPVIVGFGPAGMFAAYSLTKAGLMPVVIEQGKSAEQRKKDVKTFFDGGELNPYSNVQFGEGGAGTFSDGKLNTGIKDIRCEAVLDIFHRFGAPENILYDSKPHIGTDILVKIVSNMRKEIINLGGEIYFEHRLTDLILQNGRLISAVCQNGREFAADRLILAVGNGAREIFELLYRKGFNLQPKPFSVGVRIEHRQSFIDNVQYSGFKGLPAADYKMAVHLNGGRGVYTFCMCPGGYVINAASECGGLLTNGMSNNKRDADNANSALLVSVMPEDLPKGHPLSGMLFQREIEQKAYKLGHGYHAVSQLTEDFLSGRPSSCFKSVSPTIKPAPIPGSIEDVLPEFITDSLKEALLLFDRKIPGFAHNDAVLTAPETRSSSPVRILRDDGFQSNIKGIFPCGEGAGYAGGIMSSAVDGLKAAEHLIKSL